MRGSSAGEGEHRVEFIAAGPGDPGLLTLAGLAALQRSPYVLAPATFQRSFDLHLKGKETESPFRMDRQTLIRWVDERLPDGDVAFLVPGDFGAFCPFQLFVNHYGDRSTVTPGVSAHAAAAAVLKRTLDVTGVSHAVVLTSPRAHGDTGRVDIRNYARPGHTLVLYMNDLPLPELAEALRQGYGRDVPIAILENLFCADERVTRGMLSTIGGLVGDRDPFGARPNDPEPALALVVAGEALAADEDPAWWDRRFEKNWKPRGVR